MHSPKKPTDIKSAPTFSVAFVSYAMIIILAIRFIKFKKTGTKQKDDTRELLLKGTVDLLITKGCFVKKENLASVWKAADLN